MTESRIRDGLIAGFQLDDKDNGLIAAGLVFDGRARSDNATALCFHLEAANGGAVEVIVPYARRSPTELAFAEPQVTEVASEIFVEVK